MADPNMASEDYIAWMVETISSLEAGEDRDELVDHFLAITEQLNFLENCYHLEAYESHRSV